MANQHFPGAVHYGVIGDMSVDDTGVSEGRRIVGVSVFQHDGILVHVLDIVVVNYMVHLVQFDAA